MSKTFATAFAIGLALVGLVVVGVLYMQRGARVGLTGHMLKVRTAPLDENSSVAVLDFRIENPGNVMFVVRTVTGLMDENTGQVQGDTVSEVDAKRLFEAIPLLGQKFNDTLLTRDKIMGHSTEDRMVAARFNAPESRLDARKRFIVRIEDVDGAISDIPEK